MTPAPRPAHLVLALALVASPAAVAGTITATYAFRFAGIEVGELEATVGEDADGGYRASWRGRTTGLAGALFPFTGEGESAGRREGSSYRSRSYAAGSRRDGGEASRSRVAFGADGRAIRIEVPPEQLARREPVPDALRIGPDPAALMLAAIAAASPGARLDGASFDGKRVVRFALACADSVEAAGLRCTVAGRLVAGASRDRPPPEAPPPAPVQVWLRAGVRPSGGWWPVRVEAPTRLGTVEVRLVRAEPGSHIGG